MLFSLQFKGPTKVYENTKGKDQVVYQDLENRKLLFLRHTCTAASVDLSPVLKDFYPQSILSPSNGNLLKC